MTRQDNRWDKNISLKRSKLSYLFQWQVGWYLFNLALSHRTSLQMESSILKYEHIYLHTRDVYCVAHTHSWVNLVVPKNWGAYFSALSGRKFDLKTVLTSCWHIEWRRRGFIASGPFFSRFLTFAHEKNHFPVVKNWPYFPLIRGMFLLRSGFRF